MAEKIKIKELTKDYGKGRGIFDIDLNIYDGEVMGIVGINGAGKSTIMRHIMGYIHQSKGTVTVGVYDGWKEGIKIHQQVGYVPGEIAFPEVTTGTDFLKIQADFKAITDWDYVDSLIQRLAIDITAPINRMSKGMKQKMALVVAFMDKPDILILDEPTTGLDPLMRDTVIAMMLEAKERGATIFISSHIMKEFEDVADRVALIESGKIIEIVDMVNISGHNAIKTYTIHFETKKNAEVFIKQSSLVNFTQSDNQVKVNIYDAEVNDFLDKLIQYKIINLSQESESLEEYFNNKFNRKG